MQHRPFHRSLRLAAPLAAILCLAAAGCGSSSDSAPDAFPERAIRVVVPAAPGGSVDIVARQIEPAFTQALGGATLRIDNLPGGAMNVGAVAAAHAQPDCYTIMFHLYPNLLFGNLTTPDVDYSPDDFYPLGTATYEAPVIRVRNDSPWQSINDLVEAVRSEPGRYKTAISPLSNFHVSGLNFRKTLGLDFDMVPYGGSESRLALEKGEVDFLISGVFNTQSIASTSRVLAVIDTENRWPELTDDAPTASEALGVEIEGMSSRTMALVPAGCKTDHPDRFEILQSAFTEAVNSSAYQEAMATTGTQASRFPQGSAETYEFLQEQAGVVEALIAEYPDLRPQ